MDFGSPQRAPGASGAARNAYLAPRFLIIFVDLIVEKRRVSRAVAQRCRDIPSRFAPQIGGCEKRFSETERASAEAGKAIALLMSSGCARPSRLHVMRIR